MKIALFGLTGMGNAVLRALQFAHCPPALVITRSEKYDFPYYSEINLAEEARSTGIAVLFGSKGEAVVQDEAFDLVLVCTYHRILSSKVYGSARVAINMHPSLLPTYRGASPFYWVIRNGERATGITAHHLTKEADAGDIVLQTLLEIDPDETQGSLRKKLAQKAYDMTLQLIRNFNEQTLARDPQSQNLATSFPRVSDEVREIDESWDCVEVQRHLNALAPFPGALFKGQLVLDESAEHFFRRISAASRDVFAET